MEPWSVEAWIAFLEVCARYTWPLLVAGFLIGFKNSLSQLIVRLKKISTSGAEIHPPTPSKQSNDIKPEGIDLTQPEVSSEQEAHLNPWLTKIRSDIEELGEIELSELNQKLIFALADSQRVTDFLNIYRLIYGSQIQLLTQLSTTTELSEGSVFDHYLEHVRLAADSALTIEDWVAFITAHKLAGGDRYNLKRTNIGNDFVAFLRRLNVTATHRIY